MPAGSRCRRCPLTTAAPSCLDLQTQPVEIRIAPVPFDLGDPGRKGGRHRWWLARPGYGSKRWTRRDGYVNVGQHPATTPAFLGVSLAAEIPYCLGVGNARYTLTIPPGVCRVEVLPVDLTTAEILFIHSDGSTSEPIPF